jgi:hypothetical protein
MQIRSSLGTFSRRESLLWSENYNCNLKTELNLGFFFNIVDRFNGLKINMTCEGTIDQNAYVVIE